MVLPRFLAELRHRKVYRAAVVYAAVGWALLEAADVVLPRLGFPDWTVDVVLAVVLLGFPLAIVFAWFFFGGIAHFTMTEFFVSIVPPWVPYPLWAVYVSGVIEVALALAILWPAGRPLAGWGLIVLTLAVTPANVHMYLNPEQFPDASQEAYLVRLVVQVFLLLLIWWSTRIPKFRNDLPERA